MQELNWNDLRFVLALARAGGLSQAARNLRVNETTVSRRIARAEQLLGSRLFERVNGNILATEAGQAVIGHAERIETEVGSLTRAATGADGVAEGRVRLTSIPMLINRFLVPAFPDLVATNPLLRLELIAEPRNLSLTKRDADIALRAARPDSEQRTIARRIGALRYAVYGPTGRTAKSLPWITYDDSMAKLPHVAWIARAIKEQPGSEPHLLVNDSDVVLHAIRAGVGRSLLPCSIGDREPGLKRLSGPTPVLTRELWLLVHPELKHLARLRAVTGWLERIIAAQNLT